MTAPCPLRLAEDAAVLLRTGRPKMAATLVDQLPGAIHEAMVQVASYQYLQGRADAERIRRGKAELRPKKPTNVEWLRERIADPALRKRAKVALRLDDRLLDAIAEGRVQLSSTQWRGLREALGG